MASCFGAIVRLHVYRVTRPLHDGLTTGALPNFGLDALRVTCTCLVSVRYRSKRRENPSHDACAPMPQTQRQNPASRRKGCAPGNECVGSAASATTAYSAVQHEVVSPSVPGELSDEAAWAAGSRGRCRTLKLAKQQPPCITEIAANLNPCKVDGCISMRAQLPSSPLPCVSARIAPPRSGAIGACAS